MKNYVMPLLVVAGTLFASLMVTGCASGPQFTASPAPQHGKALLYVYRDSSIVGAANYANIYANDEFLAAIQNGTYASREVPQGTVVFHYTSRFVNGAPPFIFSLNNLDKTKYPGPQIEVEAGKTYYVKWSVGNRMALVAPETGAKEITGLHLATGKDD